jgi:hypothetical protein
MSSKEHKVAEEVVRVAAKAIYPGDAVWWKRSTSLLDPYGLYGSRIDEECIGTVVWIGHRHGGLAPVLLWDYQVVHALSAEQVEAIPHVART